MYNLLIARMPPENHLGHTPPQQILDKSTHCNLLLSYERDDLMVY